MALFSSLNISKYIPKEDYEQIQNYKKGILPIEEINKRDNELIIKAKKGDLKSRDILFFKHIPLIKYTLSKYSVPYQLYEDFLQDSFEWCRVTIKKFDVCKAESFTNLLRRNVANYVLNYYEREGRRYGNTIYLEDLEFNEQENCLNSKQRNL